MARCLSLSRTGRRCRRPATRALVVAFPDWRHVRRIERVEPLCALHAVERQRRDRMSAIRADVMVTQLGCPTCEGGAILFGSVCDCVA